jgi:hypothetical protein
MTARKKWQTILTSLTGITGLSLMLPWTAFFVSEYLGYDGGLFRTLGFVALFVVTPAIIGLGWYLREQLDNAHEAFAERLQQEGETVIVLPRKDQGSVKLDKLMLWSRLADRLPPGEHISFELSGGEMSIAYSLHGLPDTLAAVITEIKTEWPGTRVERVTEPQNDPAAVQGKAAKVYLTPARYDRPMEMVGKNPLISFFVSLSQLPAGMRAGLQVHMRADGVASKALGGRLNGIYATIQRAGGKSSPRQKKEITQLEAMLTRAYVEGELVVWVDAPGKDEAERRAAMLARSIASQFSRQNPLQIVANSQGSAQKRFFGAFWGKPCADDGLALIAHLAGDEALAVAPQLRKAPAKPLPPSQLCRVPANAVTWEQFNGKYQ